MFAFATITIGLNDITIAVCLVWPGWHCFNEHIITSFSENNIQRSYIFLQCSSYKRKHK